MLSGSQQNDAPRTFSKTSCGAPRREYKTKSPSAHRAQRLFQDTQQKRTAAPSEENRHCVLWRISRGRKSQAEVGSRREAARPIRRRAWQCLREAWLQSGELGAGALPLPPTRWNEPHSPLPLRCKCADQRRRAVQIKNFVFIVVFGPSPKSLF